MTRRRSRSRMRWGIRSTANVLLASMLASLTARALFGQAPDSSVTMLERRIAAGDRTGAHALADSLLSVMSPDASDYASLLWFRATTAANAADAERDYRRISVEYSLSPRAADALLNLAQLEYARRDRVSARRHFEQILIEHAGGAQVAKASYWIARLSLDEGDTTRACTALNTAKSSAPASDVELTNQIGYYAARCAVYATRDTTARDSSAARDSTARAPARNAEPAREFTIQVAAYQRRADAAALAAQLKKRGFASRVVGTTAPFAVRVGRFATPADAATVLAQIKRGNPRAIIRMAEPR